MNANLQGFEDTEGHNTEHPTNAPDLQNAEYFRSLLKSEKYKSEINADPDSIER